jgi:hypothetical protein
VIDHGSMGVGTEMLAKSAVVDERTTTILTLDHSFKTRSFKFNHHKSSMCGNRWTVINIMDRRTRLQLHAEDE